MRRWRASAAGESPDLHSLYMATLTLTRMAEGGLYDQLGGGFARYSVDQYWMIPHFEKMLYDNGQLLRAYASAAIATGDDLFRRIAGETADWIIRDMQSPEGGYWSTLDADSEGHEGKFYVWRSGRGAAAAAARDAGKRSSTRFGLDREPNFEGEWHLHVFQSEEDIARELGLTSDEVTRTPVDRPSPPARGAQQAHLAGPRRESADFLEWPCDRRNGRSRARTLNRPDFAASATRAVDFIRCAPVARRASAGCVQGRPVALSGVSG